MITRNETTFVLPILLAAILFGPAPLQGENRSEIRIAVLCFDNESITNHTRLDPFRKGIVEAIIGNLIREKDFRLVERARIEALLSELNLNAAGLVDSDSVQRLGRILGVQALVLGSFSAVGEMVRIDARIAEVETGNVLVSVEVSGETKDLFDIEETLAARIVEGFRKAPSGGAEKSGKPGASDVAETGARTGTVSAAGKGEVQRLAVFPFEDLGGHSGSGKWGGEIAAKMSENLHGTGAVEIVDRNRLNKIIDELASGMQGPFDAGAAQKAGRLIGADILVLGSFLSFDDRIKIHVRLVKTETGAVVAAIRALGKIGDRSALTGRLAKNIIAAGWK